MVNKYLLVFISKLSMFILDIRYVVFDKVLWVKHVLMQ